MPLYLYLYCIILDDPHYLIQMRLSLLEVLNPASVIFHASLGFLIFKTLFDWMSAGDLPIRTSHLNSSNNFACFVILMHLQICFQNQVCCLVLNNYLAKFQSRFHHIPSHLPLPPLLPPPHNFILFYVCVNHPNPCSPPLHLFMITAWVEIQPVNFGMNFSLRDSLELQVFAPTLQTS